MMLFLSSFLIISNGFIFSFAWNQLFNLLFLWRALERMFNILFSWYRLGKALKQDLVLALKDNMHLHFLGDNQDLQAWHLNLYHLELVSMGLILRKWWGFVQKEADELEDGVSKLAGRDLLKKPLVAYGFIKKSQLLLGRYIHIFWYWCYLWGKR